MYQPLPTHVAASEDLFVEFESSNVVCLMLQPSGMTVDVGVGVGVAEEVGPGVEPSFFTVCVHTKSRAEAGALAPVTEGVKSALYSAVPGLTSVHTLRSALAFSAAASAAGRLLCTLGRLASSWGPYAGAGGLILF